jgi:hypothetical protein
MEIDRIQIEVIHIGLRSEKSYCWWKKSCTTFCVFYLCIPRAPNFNIGVLSKSGLGLNDANPAPHHVLPMLRSRGAGAIQVILKNSRPT